MSWSCSVLIELAQDGHFPSALQPMQSQPASLTLMFEIVLSYRKIHVQLGGLSQAAIGLSVSTWECNREGVAGLPFLSLTLFTMVYVSALKKNQVLGIFLTSPSSK